MSIIEREPKGIDLIGPYGPLSYRAFQAGVEAVAPMDRRYLPYDLMQRYRHILRELGDAYVMLHSDLAVHENGDVITRLTIPQLLQEQLDTHENGRSDTLVMAVATGLPIVYWLTPEGNIHVYVPFQDKFRNIAKKYSGKNAPRIIMAGISPAGNGRENGTPQNDLSELAAAALGLNTHEPFHMEIARDDLPVPRDPIPLTALQDTSVPDATGSPLPVPRAQHATPTAGIANMKTYPMTFE